MHDPQKDYPLPESFDPIPYLAPIEQSYPKLCKIFRESKFIVVNEKEDSTEDSKNLSYYSILFSQQRKNESQHHRNFLKSKSSTPNELQYHPTYTNLLLFFFIRDFKNTETYFALFTELNQNDSNLKYIGLIIKLSHLQKFEEFFVQSFQNYCIVPIRSYDYELLSQLVDLSGTFKFNSDTISQAYEKESWNRTINSIVSDISSQCNVSNMSFLIISLNLILYYIILIPIYNDTPSLSGHFRELSKSNFIHFCTAHKNSYVSASHEIYLPELELYTLYSYFRNHFDKFDIEYHFYDSLSKMEPPKQIEENQQGHAPHDDLPHDNLLSNDPPNHFPDDILEDDNFQDDNQQDYDLLDDNLSFNNPANKFSDDILEDDFQDNFQDVNQQEKLSEGDFQDTLQNDNIGSQNLDNSSVNENNNSDIVKNHNKDDCIASSFYNGNLRIVPCYGYFSQQYENIFVFKFIGDTTLDSQTKIGDKSYPKSHFWDPTTKSLAMIDMLKSISYIRMLDYIQNNIKPDHFFIDRLNRAYIGGLSKMQSLKAANLVDLSGNNRYMSPEKMLKGEISELSDMYSFGLVLYYLAYEEHYVERSESMHFHDEENINALISSCLQQDPALRKKSSDLLYYLFKNNLYFDKTNANLARQNIEPFFRFFYKISMNRKLHKPEYEIRQIVLDIIFGYQNFEINSDNVYLLKHYGELFNNQILINQTDHFLSQIPEPQKNILGILFKFPNDCDDEINYFAKNFDESLPFALIHSINPPFITVNVMTRKDLCVHDSSLMVEYLLKAQAGPDDVMMALSHYQSISSFDIQKLKEAYNDQIDDKLLLSKTFNGRINEELTAIQETISSQLQEIKQMMKTNQDKISKKEETLNELSKLRKKRSDQMKLQQHLSQSINLK